jgi:hypothetical protein
MSIEEARQLVAVPETVDTVLIKNTDIDVEGELEIVKPLSATLSKRAQRSLCQLIDVPASFYHKSRKEVKAAILKQALEVPSKFKFILQDKTISNVVSSNAVYHPPKLVVDTMIETLMDHGYPLKGAMDDPLAARLSHTTPPVPMPMQRGAVSCTASEPNKLSCKSVRMINLPEFPRKPPCKSFREPNLRCQP